MEPKKPREKAVPRPGPVSEAFWEGTRQHRFMLQYDPKADSYQFFPRGISMYGTAQLEWREASGAGTLVAHTLCRTPAPGFEGDVPYLIGLVQLREGPRIFAQIVGTRFEDLKIGAPMQLVWDDTRKDYPIYQFQPGTV